MSIEQVCETATGFNIANKFVFFFHSHVRSFCMVHVYMVAGMLFVHNFQLDTMCIWRSCLSVKLPRIANVCVCVRVRVRVRMS